MNELFCEPGPSAKETPTFMAPEYTSAGLGPMRLSLHVPAPKPPAKKVSRGSPAFNLMSPIPSHKGMGLRTLPPHTLKSGYWSYGFKGSRGDRTVWPSLVIEGASWTQP